MKRPWGLLHNVVARINGAELWDLIGAISFEERCTGALETLHSEGKLRYKKLFKINDPESGYSNLVRQKTKQHLLVSQTFGVTTEDIVEVELFSPANIIVSSIHDFLTKTNGNVILDISSLPKRIFFPCLKLILNSDRVRNLIVTYSIPEDYTREPLGADTDPLGYFPLFSPQQVKPHEPEVIIIGVGYLPFDLGDLYQHFAEDVPVKVLFPFPPGPPSFQRNWQFLLDIFGEAESDSIPEPIRADARDVSYVFDVIGDLTSDGTKTACLLPFGPKPHSLAMALHSLKGKSKDIVLYTQPKAYHFDYSIGLRRSEGIPEAYGYCIKLSGNNLYF
ncbi:hypothetical protein ACLSSQ_17655 [Azospira sp. APE16]|uniref:hypothetical protein n=1 Tax=Azospira sp. APE16 TaxID=3394231 RepID=UPI003A4E0CBD